MSNLSCYAPQLVSNVSALTATGAVFPYKGFNLITLAANISSITLPKVLCGAASPLSNGTSCVACPSGTYYLLSNNTCYVPHLVSNIHALNATGKVVNIGNATLFNLAANITAIPFPVLICTPGHPLFNGTACEACPNGTYYLIKNHSCYTPGFVTNIPYFIKSGQYLNFTALSAISLKINKRAYPVSYTHLTLPTKA